ncbi:MAG: hypothetical protein IJL92_09865 [Thermoguttaceae bacterium]|nr:hypothetical protein [Thermoguttaceae bacterium]
MTDEITCSNAGFENQTTLNALIGTGVTDGSAYATIAASILSDVNDVTAADASFRLAALVYWNVRARVTLDRSRA